MIQSEPMLHPDSPAAARFWRHRASALALRLNFHHWLTRVVPKLSLLLVLVALFDLARREAGMPAGWSAAMLLLGLGVVSGWAWLEARSHFCQWRKALVRLETVLGLHNQLSSAQDGIQPWPAARMKIDDGYSTNWKQILLPILAGIIFLCSAHLVPVSTMKSGAAAEPISEPPDLTQVQSWINALKADALVQPDKLQEMQSALDKLRERPAPDWYKQDSLEAADSLKELTEQSMNSLSRDLDKADQAVQGMQEKMDGSTGASGLQPMQDELRSAEENLASGNLPLSQELVEQLKAGEGATDKALSASQLAALHERLKKGELAARTAAKSDGALSEEMQEAMAEAAMEPGGRRYKVAVGTGGLGGGTESAPLELQERESTTPQGALTPVHNDDMSRVSLGQTIKISASGHKVDPTAYRGVQSAGSAQVDGNGGDVVWRSTYDPQEADTLSRFFK